MKKLSPAIVLVKNIHCPLPHIEVPETTIEAGAKLILEVEGVINPLLLRREGIEHYTVIDGHIEYYAALRARELDLSRGETINAYIVDPDNEMVLMEQIKIFREAKYSMTQNNLPSQTVSSAQTSVIIDSFNKHLQDLSHTVQVMVHALSHISSEISALQSTLSTLAHLAPTPTSLSPERVPTEQAQFRTLDTSKEVSRDVATEPVAQEVKTQGVKVATKKPTPVERAKKTSTKVEVPSKATEVKSLPALVKHSPKTTSSVKTSTDEFLNQLNNLHRNDLISALNHMKIKGDIIDALLKARPFRSLADLRSIKGLGEKTLDKIKKIWE